MIWKIIYYYIRNKAVFNIISVYVINESSWMFSYSSWFINKASCKIDYEAYEAYQHNQ